jgi:hypothetical protein
MHIVILGDPINGFTYIGPFPTKADADEYVDNDASDDYAWIVMLTAPGDALE